MSGTIESDESRYIAEQINYIPRTVFVHNSSESFIDFLVSLELTLDTESFRMRFKSTAIFELIKH